MKEYDVRAEKSTDHLMQELMQTPDIDRYMKEQAACFSDKKVSELLTSFYAKKPISKAELARRSNMSEVYLHQLFSGRRNPSRDKMLCLCVGMGLSIDESQMLLKNAAFAPLYPRKRREAIIYHGIAHQLSLKEINENLFREKEDALG